MDPTLLTVLHVRSVVNLNKKAWERTNTSRRRWSWRGRGSLTSLPEFNGEVRQRDQWRSPGDWWAHTAHRWGTPRGSYNEHSSKFSFSKKPRFNRPVGERRDFWRYCWLTIGRAHYRRQQQRGTCTQHNQNTLPQLTVRLSISPVLLNTKD